MKKLISSLTAVSMLVAACSPQTKETIREIQVAPKAGDQVVVKNEDHLKWKDLESLIKSDSQNPAIASWLVREYVKQNAGDVQKDKSSLSAEVLLQLKQELQKHYTDEATQIYMGDSSLRSNKEYMAATVLVAGKSMENANAFSNEIDIQVAAFAQSEALKRIFEALNKELSKSSGSLARAVVEDLKKRHPEAIQKADSLISADAREKSLKLKEILIKYDSLLAKYDFGDDGTKIMVYSLVAQALLDSLNQNGTVLAIVKTAEEVRDFGKRINEVRLSIAALDNSRKQLKKNWEDVSEAFKTLKGDISYYYESGGFDISSMDLKDRTKAELARAVGDVLVGKFDVPAAKDQKGIFTEGHPLDQNTRKFFDTAANAANAVGNIANSIQNIAATLHIDVPEGLQNVINTAQTVSQGAQLVSSMMTAYSTGGLVAAVGAFSAGPGFAIAAGVMGGMGGGQQQNEAYFKQILKELGEIKELQRQTIDLQKTTMQMIRDLAVMVDEYHKEDLYKMDQIYHQVVTNTQLLQMIAQTDLASCQSMISVIQAKMDGLKEKKVSSIDNVITFKSQLNQINSLNDVSNLLSLPARIAVDQCQSAVLKTFTLDSNTNSPLFAAFYANAGKAEAEKERLLYRGALQYLKGKNPRGDSIESMGLHLPLAKYQSLQVKDYYLRRQNGSGEFVSQMENLISPEGLESYTAAALSLHSLVSIDRENWKSSQSVLDMVWSSDGLTRPVATDRSRLALEGALSRSKIAVAQDALLVGEPLMRYLAEDWPKIVQAAQASDCKELDESVRYNNFCFLRQNTLMMKNLLSYQLTQYILGSGSAINPDQWTSKMADILAVPKDRVISESGRLYFVASKDKAIKVEIPSYEQIKNGYISYSASMPKLLQIQRMLSEELAQFSPLSTELRTNGESLAKMYLMRAN